MLQKDECSISVVEPGCDRRVVWDSQLQAQLQGLLVEVSVLLANLSLSAWLSSALTSHSMLGVHCICIERQVERLLVDLEQDVDVHGGHTVVWKSDC